MYSYNIPLEELKRRSVSFWLPPGGRDNGVWADTWVMLAELEADDTAPVLNLLAQNEVGGYTVHTRSPRVRTNGCHLLYVDTTRYHQAEDVLMIFLRGKTEGVMKDRAVRRPVPGDRWRARTPRSRRCDRR